MFLRFFPFFLQSRLFVFLMICYVFAKFGLKILGSEDHISGSKYVLYYSKCLYASTARSTVRTASSIGKGSSPPLAFM